MAYSVGMAHRGPNVEGWVFELAGCRAVGGSVEEIEALLPIVIADHVTWLERNGEKADQSSTDYTVVENPEPTNDVTFEWDKGSMTDHDLATNLRHLRTAYEGLKQVADLPDSLLDWVPPPSSVKIDAIYPDVRSMREMLTHVAGSMLFFTRNILESPPASLANPAPSPGPAFTGDVFANAEQAFDLLAELTENERSSVYKQEGSRGSSVWTARKVFRRLIMHNRFHTREIEQRLGWLTLGVPQVISGNRE